MATHVAKSWHFCLIFCIILHAVIIFCEEYDVKNVRISNGDGREYIFNVRNMKQEECSGFSEVSGNVCGAATADGEAGQSNLNREYITDNSHLFRDPDLLPTVTVTFGELSPLCSSSLSGNEGKNLPKGLCTLNRPMKDATCAKDKVEVVVSQEMVESYTQKIIRGGMIPFKTANNDLNKEIVYGMVLMNMEYVSDAIRKFTHLIQEYPDCVGCYVARGMAFTRHSVQENFEQAMSDFDKSLTMENSNSEIFLRRAEVLAPIGRHEEAIDNINQAYNLDPTVGTRYFRAMVSLMRDDLFGAETDFRAVLESEDGEYKEKSLYYLAVTLYLRGRLRNSIEVYLDVLKLDENNADALTGLGQAYKALGNAKLANEYLTLSLEKRPGHINTLQLRGTMFYHTGNLYNALIDFDRCIELKSTNTMCVYMRGLTFAAMGRFYDGVKDHTKVLVYSPLTKVRVTPEFVKAHYLREFGRYLHAHLDARLDNPLLLDELSAPIKHNWIQQRPFAFNRGYIEQPGIQANIGDVEDVPWKQLPESTRSLVCRARKIGALTQVNADGFLANQRLNTAMGLAAIHVAQMVEKRWRTDEPNGSDRKYDSFTWREVFSTAVQYRRLVDPELPVFWFDTMADQLVTFGYQIDYNFFNGQMTNVKLNQYYDMVFRLVRTMVEHYQGDDASDYPGYKDELAKVVTCSDLLNIVRKRGINKSGFIVTTQVPSSINKSDRLDGVVLSLTGHGPEDLVFAINLSVNKPRLLAFYSELDFIFNKLNEQVKRNSLSKIADVDGVMNLILTMVYYLYNLMPLSRGSSVVAYTVTLGLLMSIGKDVTGKIPPGRLVDLEAMLAGGPDSFILVVKQWMNIRKSTVPLSQLPQVEELLTTPRDVIRLLNAATYAQC